MLPRAAQAKMRAVSKLFVQVPKIYAVWGVVRASLQQQRPGQDAHTAFPAGQIASPEKHPKLDSPKAAAAAAAAASSSKHFIFDLKAFPTAGYTKKPPPTPTATAALSAALATAKIYLQGTTSLVVEGPDDAIGCVLKALNSNGGLSTVRYLGVRLWLDPPTFTSFALMFRSMSALRTLCLQGVSFDLTHLSSLLADVPLNSLSYEYIASRGVLLLPQLRQLGLIFSQIIIGTEGIATNTTACFTSKSCPYLTDLEVTHKFPAFSYLWERHVQYQTEDWSYPDGNTALHNILFNMLPKFPLLQSLIVQQQQQQQQQQSNYTREMVVDSDLLALLASLKCLKHLAVGGFDCIRGLPREQRELTSLTSLQCETFHTGTDWLLLAPMIHSLDCVQLYDFPSQCDCTLPLTHNDDMRQQLDPRQQRIPYQITALGLPSNYLSPSGNSINHVTHLTIHTETETETDSVLPDFSVCDVLESFTLSASCVQAPATTVVRFLEMLHCAPRLTTLRIINCGMDEKVVSLLKPQLTHIALERCRVTKALIHNIINSVPKLLILEVLTCEGVSMEECMDIQQTNKGTLAFRLICYRAL